MSDPLLDAHWALYMNDLSTATQPCPSGEGEDVLNRMLLSGQWTIPESIKDAMKARVELGSRRYGTRLKTLNGRIPSIDCFQEIIDAVLYAAQEFYEHQEYDWYCIVEEAINLAMKIECSMKRNL